jgi:hypothetical protein
MSSLKTTNILNPSSTTNNIVLAADGSTTISTLTATTIQGTIKSGTAVASTSGTSIDFTGIPSWVKRITVMLQDVSTNGTSLFQVQVGSGSVSTSGYAAQAWAGGASTGVLTSGIPLDSTSHVASYSYSGILFLCLISANRWIASGQIAYTNVTSNGHHTAGSTPSLSGALDRVRITTINGTDTFDAGTINLLWEG